MGELSTGAGSGSPDDEAGDVLDSARCCDGTRPGLEVIRAAAGSSLHFTELDDARLRRRFAPEYFWAPAMEPGDALIFSRRSPPSDSLRAGNEPAEA